MLTSAEEWLLLLGVTVFQALYVAWHVARRHTHREIDREYEKLCTETGREIF
ncbi:MAG: hypothetical protein FWE35_14940 [Streptosporangiales bacterium]|jgi:hypothetical protein|nr:hypothetical protein [Streptosporangiales bacterium]